jgi:acyl-CoA synthetase (AMP-forming)/AMP-acid ligase II
LRERFTARFGVPVPTGYGLTEAPTAVTSDDPTAGIVRGASGRALPWVRINIRELGADRRLSPGEVGEICVEPADEPPWRHVWTPMLGYWHRPDLTRNALRGGVLRTGDLGHVDGDGNLFVHGRASDVIFRGGANVYPEEIERVLDTHPGVAGSAVLGRADERLGQRVVAVVECKAGAHVDTEALAAFCARRLARYKVPEQWCFVDVLPRNAMGKVVRAALRDVVARGSGAQGRM